MFKIGSTVKQPFPDTRMSIIFHLAFQNSSLKFLNRHIIWLKARFPITKVLVQPPSFIKKSSFFFQSFIKRSSWYRQCWIKSCKKKFMLFRKFQNFIKAVFIIIIISNYIACVYKYLIFFINII